MILYKKHKEKQGNVGYLQFLLYGSEETVTLLYMIIDGRYWLHDVGIQYYKDDRIVKNDIAVWGMGGDVQDLQSVNRESYIYENEVLTNAWKEKFIFPDFLSVRDFYTFRYDEEGYISEFLRREFWGDGERKFPWGKQYTPVQEQKRKDTGKDSARWKKPNYFEIK